MNPSSQSLPRSKDQLRTCDVVASEHTECYEVLQCEAVRCSVLQCVAVCCSVLQCVAVCNNKARLIIDGVLQLTVADFLSVVGKNPDRNRDVIRALSKSSKDRIARLKRMAHCPSYVARYICMIYICVCILYI